MKIKYILGRANHEDNLYKTGSWNIDETKEVPDDVAVKLIRHSDVYAKSGDKASSVVAVKPESKDDEADSMQAVYDQVNAMGKDAIKSFIKTQFNQEVDLRQYKEIGSLRSLAIRLADQYGVLK